MSSNFAAFEVGTLYSNEAIFKSLACGNTGGVRVKLDALGQVRRAALFTSAPTPRQLLENPYIDRLEGDVLVYTGTGKSGNQDLTGPNARLKQQPEQGFPIYGFAQVASRRAPSGDNKRWIFLGLMDFLRCYQERQVDAVGNWRTVWVFELQVHATPNTVPVDEDRAAAVTARASAGSPLQALDQELGMPSKSDAGNSTSVDIAALEPIRKRLLALEPRSFELFVRDLLKSFGFQDVEVTRFSQDGGIDVNARPARDARPIRQLLIQIQAKRWLHTVGRKEVAELRGSLQPHAAGCVVTTSHFSRAALQEAREPGKLPIALIDGYELAHWAQKAQLEIG
jgi:HJR/Mrr/RecB family endonuclease